VHSHWPSPEDFNEKIESVVSEESRREEIRDVIDEAAKRMTENIDEIKNSIQKGRQLNLDYAATEDDFTPIIAQFIKEQKKVQQEITDLHFRLREKINEQEWVLIFENSGNNSSDQ
jgi:uncharacterized protein YpuA (DUF1002 family)